MTTIEIDADGTPSIDGVDIDPGMVADIAKFEATLARYLAGEIDEDVFRVFRLTNGIYGQRQGGHNQMIRVKAPYGGVTPDQLDLLRPTRRRATAGAGATSPPGRTCSSTSSTWSRSPTCCGTSRRSASPPARPAATPSATCRAATSPAPAPTRCSTSRLGRGHLPALRAQPDRPAPAPQVQDQLLGLRDRLRPGHVQRRRRRRRHPAPLEDGTVEQGFRVFVAGGLGANPHPGARPRGVHAPGGPAAHHRVDPAGLRADRQPRQQAAGPG